VSTRSPEISALEPVAARLGIPPSELTGRSLNRGVTHDTRLVEHGGLPVAVLRLAPAEDVVLPGLDLRREGELLCGLVAAGVPRPELLLCDPDGDRFGRPGLLFEYVAGDNPQRWPDLRRLGGDACAGDALAILLALHRAPPPAPGPALGLDGSATARLSALRRRAEVAGGPAAAALRETLDALAATPPPPTAGAWVHGDFRPSNLVVRDGRVAAVLDWEMAGWGDPARDLGIATMPDWGVWWPDDELLERYHRAGGAEIAATTLLWWRCLGYAMVVGFLVGRLAAGWRGGPPLDAFAGGLRRAREAWEAAA
jgi:aminoglycoside phosphotransferase (APT) family kinase protein